MSNTVYSASGDSLPPVEAVLSDRDGPVNLAGASVRFRTSNGLDEEASIVDADAGQVRFEWGFANRVPVGRWRAWFYVTFPGSGTMRFPNNGYIQLVVLE